jgi:hypothetical protein
MGVRGGVTLVSPPTRMRLRHIHKVVPILCVSGWRSIHPSFSIWRRQRCTCLVDILSVWLGWRPKARHNCYQC